MHTRFIHAADIHLGYEQYNLAARADDFARAFLAMVAHAVQVEADFVLLAGDLFHRASADAWMLQQATAGLQLLRDAGIPVVAVEGNHDAQHARKHLSWLEYLCDQGLLILLNLTVHSTGYKALQPWTESTGRGAWIDLAGVRIYGLKYYGAITSRILEEVRDQIEAGPEGYTVLMLHAGIQGQVPHVHGGLTPADMLPLHPPVDYLALGHVHKRLDAEDGWIFNPGSTETNSMEELDWLHGFFDVQVDLALPTKHRATPVELPGRPFCRISVSAEGVPTIAEFAALVEQTIAEHHSIPDAAVIELYLGGTATFRRQDVPLERLTGAVMVRFSPLAVRVRNNLVPPGMVEVRHGERLRRSDLERTVIEQLVRQHGEYRERVDDWTRLILDVKNMAAERALPADIVERVQNQLAAVKLSDESSIADPVPKHEVAELPPVMAAASTPREPEEPFGGEEPCLAPLFEDW